jgi:hypothetical protein
MALLDKKESMETRLGIRAIGYAPLLPSLADILKVSIPTETPYLLQLANNMETFLTEVEKDKKVWDYSIALTLFGREDIFKEISSAWYQVTARDFLAGALIRHRDANIAMRGHIYD